MKQAATFTILLALAAAGCGEDPAGQVRDAPDAPAPAADAAETGPIRGLRRRRGRRGRLPRLNMTTTHLTPHLTPFLPLGVLALMLAGCEGDDRRIVVEDDDPDVVAEAEAGGGPPPVFTLAWSEYPSWSVFGVAEQRGLIDGQRRRDGRASRPKHNVDIELRGTDYDTCLVQYANGQLDAVCITNIDILSAGADDHRASAILPDEHEQRRRRRARHRGHRRSSQDLKDDRRPRALRRASASTPSAAACRCRARTRQRVLGSSCSTPPETAATAMQTGNADTEGDRRLEPVRAADPQHHARREAAVRQRR